jgi:hypothetical protein
MAVNNRLFKENFEASLVQNFQVTTENLRQGCCRIILKTQIFGQGTKYVEMQLLKSKNSATMLPQNYIENTDFLGGKLNM